jgi:hypothetical protein
MASKPLNFARDSQEKRFRLSTTALFLYSMSQKSWNRLSGDDTRVETNRYCLHS